MEPYNGWKNKPTWLLYTWLSNDYESYHEIQELAKDLSERESPVDELATVLKDRTEDMLPEKAGLDADLLQWATSYIDYHAVAEAFLQEEYGI